MSSSEEDWPSLVDESRVMLDASILIYGLTCLREMARNGKLAGQDVKERILDVPITIEDCIQVAASNRQTLEAYLGEEEMKLHGSALLSIRESLYKDSTEHEDSVSKGSSIVVIDDERSTSECVYAIGVNKPRKRILLVFRGSVTVKDFMVDADGYMCPLPNPLSESGETIGIHHGFYEYLNGVSSAPSRHKTSRENKFTTIANHLNSLFEQYPDFQLYTTGHSLGGALATLFAAEVAASSSDHDIPMPVTCISFASPKVGDIDFWKAFEKLEQDGLVRSVRFVNNLDFIPNMPDRSNCSCIRNRNCRKPPVYRHVGPRIKLYADGTYEASYEAARVETTWEKLEAFRWSFGHQVGFVMLMPSLYRYKENFSRYHSCAEYVTRFNHFANDKGNKELYLKDLYKVKVQNKVGSW